MVTSATGRLEDLGSASCSRAPLVHARTPMLALSRTTYARTHALAHTHTYTYMHTQTHTRTQQIAPHQDFAPSRLEVCSGVEVLVQGFIYVRTEKCHRSLRVGQRWNIGETLLYLCVGWTLRRSLRRERPEPRRSRARDPRGDSQVPRDTGYTWWQKVPPRTKFPSIQKARSNPFFSSTTPFRHQGPQGPLRRRPPPPPR